MQYYAAAMAAMFLLFNAMAGGKSFHQGTADGDAGKVDDDADFLRSILIGKFIGTFLFAFLQFTVFMAVTHYLLKVDWGSNSHADILHRNLLLYCCFRLVDGDGSLYDG